MGRIRAEGGSAVAVACDVSDPDAVAAAVAEATSALGPVGVLVNDAGFARDNTVLDMPLADWDAVDTHLRGSPDASGDRAGHARGRVETHRQHLQHLRAR